MREFQSIFFLSSIHCLFHHPIFYAHNLWQKMFYDKMFRYCLHTAKPTLTLSLALLLDSRNVLNVRSVRLNCFAFVCSSCKGMSRRGVESERYIRSSAKFSSALYYFVYRCFDDKHVAFITYTSANTSQNSLNLIRKAIGGPIFIYNMALKTMLSNEIAFAV